MAASSSTIAMRRAMVRGLYPKASRGQAAMFSPFFFPALPLARPGGRRLRALNGGNKRSHAMTKQPPIAIELAAPVVLPAAIGLFVAIVLAGGTMLLAG